MLWLLAWSSQLAALGRLWILNFGGYSFAVVCERVRGVIFGVLPRGVYHVMSHCHSLLCINDDAINVFDSVDSIMNIIKCTLNSIQRRLNRKGCDLQMGCCHSTSTDHLELEVVAFA